MFLPYKKQNAPSLPTATPAAANIQGPLHLARYLGSKSKRKIRKAYDESEHPRDEHGRWTIEHVVDENSRGIKTHTFSAVVGGKEVGSAEIKEGDNYISSVKVDPEFRRQGVASALYRRVEDHFDIKLRRADVQTPDAEAFWRNRRVAKAAPKSLYVSRKVVNADDLVKWAKSQGFDSVVSDLHVTIAYSSKPIDWNSVQPAIRSEITCAPGARRIDRLGDATVLRFECAPLKRRWKQIKDAGASWDYDNYKPHITISLQADDLDLKQIEPYNGPIVLGPEVFAEVDEDYKDKIVEKANECHEPAGSSEGGQFCSTGGGGDYSNLRTMPKEIEGVTIIKKPLGGGMLAIGGTSGIAVSTSKRAREAWKDMATYQQKAFDSGWQSSPHPNHVIWHELAHVKVKNEVSVDHDSYLTNLRPLSNDHFEKMAAKVSKYAGTNGHEFIAEVFAARRAGRSLDNDVMDYYKHLKGPRI